MYSVIIDKRGGLVHAPRNKITAEPGMLISTILEKQRKLA